MTAVVGLLACSTDGPGPKGGAGEAARLGADLSEAGLKRLSSTMDPATRALAQRHDPVRQADLWGRPEGWASYDIATAPTLGFLTATDDSARRINELLAFSDEPVRPMRPFVLAASGADRARALKCLAEAVYYEAAREPVEGQRAVAQTVLNRLRHPEYPKTVCGVVYQGSARLTGCQFSFTCDGSLRWAPERRLWAQAERVAREALDGYVFRPIGSATHYHADYVAPYWAPTLVKLKQIGAHIFYRWTGPAGLPGAFNGRYAGGEAYLSPAVLQSADARTQGLLSPEAQGVPAGRTVVLAVGGEVRTYKVADASEPDGVRTRVVGTLQPARRKPTPEEIKKINESLAALERGMDAAATAPEPAPETSSEP